MTILLDTTNIHDIPVLTLTPGEADRCPLIFFVHGFGGSKETGLSLGYQLAQHGFCFVSFDAWLHGERYDMLLEQVAAQTRRNTAFVAAIDPIEKLKSAAPRALLIMNNDFDSDQPKHYAIDCYRELQSSYAAQPDHLRLNIYPAGHLVTSQMERDAVEWFAIHLR